MRTCEIRKPHKDDEENERKQPKLKKRREDREKGQDDAVDGLIQDAIDQDRPVPDIEEVFERVQHLEAHCAPHAPRQRVTLWLVDEPPYFRASTAAIKESKE